MAMFQPPSASASPAIPGRSPPFASRSGLLEQDEHYTPIVTERQSHALVPELYCHHVASLHSDAHFRRGAYCASARRLVRSGGFLSRCMREGGRASLQDDRG